MSLKAVFAFDIYSLSSSNCVKGFLKTAVFVVSSVSVAAFVPAIEFGSLAISVLDAVSAGFLLSLEASLAPPKAFMNVEENMIRNCYLINRFLNLEEIQKKNQKLKHVKFIKLCMEISILYSNKV